MRDVQAMTERLVHFIYLGGPFTWQHWRAVETAKVHGAEIVMWRTPGIAPEGEFWDALDIRTEPLEVATWLWEHPIGLANVKDYWAWRILNEHGGLYLDLDTISLQPCWDLLTRDVCVSSEREPGFDGGPAYNSAVVLARQGASVLAELHDSAYAILARSEARWGACGPHLLTEFVAGYPARFDVAPFGVLNGWRDDTIHRYYEGERPGPDVRVVHLYSSSRMESFLADRWMP